MKFCRPESLSLFNGIHDDNSTIKVGDEIVSMVYF